jgi:hypothetical protein
MTQAPRFGAPMPAQPLDPVEELESLRRKLDKRQDEPGYSANVEAIKARIAELEAAEFNGD